MFARRGGPVSQYAGFEGCAGLAATEPQCIRRRTSARKEKAYVGLDVHKDTIVVSFAEAGLRGEPREVREYGKIVNTPTAVKALATKLAARERTAVLLRGWPVRLRRPAAAQWNGTPVCGCCSVVGPAKTGRADQD